MATGICKWFAKEKGYGFVIPDGGGKDLFCHYSDIKGDGYKELSEGQKISFDVTLTEKGRKATNIVKL